MIIDDPNELDDFERLLRFNEIAEQYGRSIAAWETAPWTTEFELLQQAGLDLPPPRDLDDDTLTDRLWRIIESLAGRNTFLCCTDHLSERELYTRLWEELLHRPTRDFAAVLPAEELTKAGAWVQFIDVCDYSDPADEEDFLRYFADEQLRDWHAQDAPGTPLPDPCEPPYDRDRFLPRPIDDRAEEAGELLAPDQLFDEGLPEWMEDAESWLDESDPSCDPFGRGAWGPG